MTRYILTTILLAVLTAVAAPASAADQEEIKTLRGLTGVYVTVDDLNPAMEMMGLSSKKIHGDVALRLRQKGIRLFTVEEMREHRGLPILKVLVNVHKAADNLYVYAIDIYLQQTVTLARETSVTGYAITWKTGTLGILSKDQLGDMSDQILGFVDEFASDYREVNPRHST